MYRVWELPATPALLNEPLRMPLDVLLGLPAYTTSDPDTAAPLGLFHVIIDNVLGRAMPERALQIIHPRGWAPAWDDTQLLDALAMDAGRPELLRAAGFPGVPPWPTRPPASRSSTWSTSSAGWRLATAWPPSTPARPRCRRTS